MTKTFESPRAQYDYEFLRKHHYHRLAGFDEVAVGSIAGPLIAASVILPADFDMPIIKDSKRFYRRDLEHFTELAKLIIDNAVDYAVGIVPASIVDEINPIQADKLAMLKALSNLKIKPDALLIDGNNSHSLPQLKYPEYTLIGGDQLSQSIAAASILASYMEYKIMHTLDGLYPEYEFGVNRGYYHGQDQLNLLIEHGISPVHRVSYNPVRSNFYKWKHKFSDKNGNQIVFNVHLNNLDKGDS